MAEEKIYLPTVLDEIEPGFENRISNVSQQGRGRDLGKRNLPLGRQNPAPVQIKTDSGDWFITRIKSVEWPRPDLMTIEGRLKRKIDDQGNGIPIRIRLYTSLSRPVGTVKVIYDYDETQEDRDYENSFTELA